MLLIPLILLMVHAHAACNLNVLVALDRTFIPYDPVQQGKDARALLHGALAQANFSALHMSVLELKHNKFNWLHAPRTYTRDEREEALGAIMDARAGVRARGVQFAPIFRGFLKYHAPFDEGHRRVILLASDFRYGARTLRAGARAKYWLTRTLGRRHAPVVVCLRTAQARATRAERALCDKVFYEGQRATLQEVLWGASRIMCPVVDMYSTNNGRWGPLNMLFADGKIRVYEETNGRPWQIPFEISVTDNTLDNFDWIGHSPTDVHGQFPLEEGEVLLCGVPPDYPYPYLRQYMGYFELRGTKDQITRSEWHPPPQLSNNKFKQPQQTRLFNVTKCLGGGEVVVLLEYSGRITPFGLKWRGGEILSGRRYLFSDVFILSGSSVGGVLFDGTVFIWGKGLFSRTLRNPPYKQMIWW